MGDRNKNTIQGFKSNVQVRVQAQNVSGSKHAESGKTQSRSTMNMGVAQTSRCGGGNTQNANKVRVMTTTQQTHSTRQNRPVQNDKLSNNHGPQQNRPKKAPFASSEQNISININLANLVANQLRLPNNQKPNWCNQQHNQGKHEQHRSPRQPTAGGNQKKPAQQNPKNTGEISQKVFMNMQNKY